MLIDFRIVVSKRSRKEEGDDSHRSIIDNGKEIIETPKRAVVKINERRERDDLSENAQDEEHRSDDREGDDAVAGTHDGADKTCIGEFADCWKNLLIKSACEVAFFFSHNKDLLRSGIRISCTNE